MSQENSRVDAEVVDLQDDSTVVASSRNLLDSNIPTEINEPNKIEESKSEVVVKPLWLLLFLAQAGFGFFFGYETLGAVGAHLSKHLPTNFFFS